MKKQLLFINLFFITGLVLMFATSCKKSPVTSVGTSYEGGVVFYLDGSGQHGYVASASDQKGNASGLESWNQAKVLCDNLNTNGYNGYHDWHLPTPSELNMLYTNRTTIGGFSRGFYWGSQCTPDSAYAVGFSYDGEFGNCTDKSGTYRVRAVRSF